MFGKITFELLNRAIFLRRSSWITGFGETKLKIPFSSFSIDLKKIIETSSIWIHDCHWFPVPNGDNKKSLERFFVILKSPPEVERTRPTLKIEKETSGSIFS